MTVLTQANLDAQQKAVRRARRLLDEAADMAAKAANQYAMCLAYGPADGETYRGLSWVDSSGNLYAATSFEARGRGDVLAAQAPLVRPAWDVDEIIDMVAAERGQAVLVYSTEAILAPPAALTAIGGMSGPDALSSMGLTVVQEEGL
jgi:hypothetical protein